MGGRVRLAVGLVAVLALAACGGGSGAVEEALRRGSASTTSTTKTAAGGEADRPDEKPSSGQDARGGDARPEGRAGSPTPTSASGSTGGGTTATTEAREPAPLEVTVAKPCIKAGERQTITIQALPHSAVVYDSYYSDGKSGISEGFYGGNNGAVVPDSGTWTDTWVVAPHAPAGNVRVITMVSSYRKSRTTVDRYYRLVSPTESCPAS